MAAIVNAYQESIEQSVNQNLDFTSVGSRKVRLSHTPEANSVYFYIFSALISSNINTFDVKTRLHHSTANVTYTSFNQEMKTVIDFQPVYGCGIQEYGASPGLQNIDVDFCIEDAAHEARIEEARIFAIKKHADDLYDENLGQSTSTTSTWVTKGSVTLPEGVWAVFGFFEWRHSTNGTRFGARLLIDGAEFGRANMDARDASNWAPWQHHEVVTVTAGNTKVTNLQFASVDNALTARCQNARIFAIKLNNANAHFFAALRPEATESSGNFITPLTKNHTPGAEADYVVFMKVRRKHAVINTSSFTRFRENGNIVGGQFSQEANGPNDAIPPFVVFKKTYPAVQNVFDFQKATEVAGHDDTYGDAVFLGIELEESAGHVPGFVELAGEINFTTNLSGSLSVPGIVDLAGSVNFITTVSGTLAGINVPAVGDYFVDAQNGNDNNNGTSPETAWRTTTKVNNFSGFQPGDLIVFKAGQEWRPVGSNLNGKLVPPRSGVSGNRLRFGRYGDENDPDPILYGSRDLLAENLIPVNLGSNRWAYNIPPVDGANPAELWINNQRANDQKTSVTAVTQFGDWHYDAPNNRAVMFSTQDPRTNPAIDNLELQVLQRGMDLLEDWCEISDIQFLRHKIGVAIRGGVQNELHRCTIQQNSRNGLWFQLTANNNLIKDCDMSNNGNLNVDSSPPAYVGHAFKWSDQSHSNTVDGCRLDACVEDSIQIQSSGATPSQPNFLKNSIGIGSLENFGDHKSGSVVYENNYGEVLNGADEVINLHYNSGSNYTTEMYDNIWVGAPNTSSFKWDRVAHLIMKRNFVRGHPNGGRGAYGSPGRLTLESNIFAYANGGAANTIEISSGSNHRIVHNTFYGGSGKRGMFIASGVVVDEFLNNILDSNNAVCLLNSGTINDHRGNLYYRRNSPGGDLVSSGGQIYNASNLDDWEPSAVFGDPLFKDVANDDFTLLAGSPARNAGVAGTGVTTDFNNNPFETPNPSIGAISAETSDFVELAGTISLNTSISGLLGRQLEFAGQIDLFFSLFGDLFQDDAVELAGAINLAIASQGSMSMEMLLTGLTAVKFDLEAFLQTDREINKATQIEPISPPINTPHFQEWLENNFTLIKDLFIQTTSTNVDLGNGKTLVIRNGVVVDVIDTP